MRIEIPQVFWHGNRDRIMSLDFYPNTNYLVTCGAETEDKMWVKIWVLDYRQIPAQTSQNQSTPTNTTTVNANITTSTINPPLNNSDPLSSQNISNNNQSNLPEIPVIIQNDSPNTKITFHIIPIFDKELSGAHNATVNICRFSPDGKYLATGGDDSSIVIWVQKSKPVSYGATEEKIMWSNYKILRGHLSDVYDICWSPDSKYLISGSVDNSAIVWNVEKGKGVQKFNDHSHFVQGVSWDPRNKFIVTQSNDRSVRFYRNAVTKVDIKFFYLNQMKRFEVANNINACNDDNDCNNAMNNNNKNNNKNYKNKDENKDCFISTSNNNDNNNDDNDKMMIDEEDEKDSIRNNNDKMEIDEENANNNNNIQKQNNTNNPLSSSNQKPSSQNKSTITNANNNNNNIPKQSVSYHYYFADETQCPTFIRRHAWSPDGSICLLVSGIAKIESNNHNNELDFVVWGVSRKDFSKPLFYIPTLDKSSTCIRFCPIIFKNDDNKSKDDPPALLDLPYTMVFAIGTIDSVFIYGTDSIKPRYAITNIHYQSITDLAWKDDTLLAISSSDGYVSFCIFDNGELGQRASVDDLSMDQTLQKHYQEYLNVDINKNVFASSVVTTVVKPKKKKKAGNNNDNKNDNNINSNNNANSEINNNNNNAFCEINNNNNEQNSNNSSINNKSNSNNINEINNNK